MALVLFQAVEPPVVPRHVLGVDDRAKRPRYCDLGVHDVPIPAFTRPRRALADAVSTAGEVWRSSTLHAAMAVQANSRCAFRKGSK
jgi:hypothetical protein